MNEQLAQGLQLMGVGMGVVFLFLGLLVWVITAVSALIQKSEAVEVHSDAELLSNDDLQAVLTEAVKRYRTDHPK
jgi:oxaloacetate decarboxylase gamma subunit